MLYIIYYCTLISHVCSAPLNQVSQNSMYFICFYLTLYTNKLSSIHTANHLLYVAKSIVEELNKLVRRSQETKCMSKKKKKLARFFFV